MRLTKKVKNIMQSIYLLIQVQFQILINNSHFIHIQIQAYMGNIQEFCQFGFGHQNQKEQGKVADFISKSRVEVNEIPSIPINASKKICELAGYTQLSDAWQASKIWKVQEPCKFYYINEPENKDSLPTGLCTIFTFGIKNQFESFSRGKIDSRFMLQTKGSISYYLNGDYFIGDHVKDEFGKYVNEAQNYQYEGDYLHGKPHGLGRQKFKKYVYEGYFFYGVKQGRGRIEFQNGFVCEGQFSKNQINGQAKLISQQNKYSYDGSFKIGEKSGIGVEKTNEYVYEGNFQKNKKNGRGKISYLRQQWSYEGFFKDDHPHGRGAFTKNNKAVKGVWNNGTLIAIQNLKQ